MILGRVLRGRVGVFCQQVAGFVVDELDRFAVGGLECQLSLRVVEEAGEALAVLQGDAGATDETTKAVAESLISKHTADRFRGDDLISNPLTGDDPA
ncbi:hypothetical protein [Chitinivorax sp. B]|uniref:hypothetical protein n=1 Tax=Chitinivorax sp. B TaxID=2502235 RepID=UPI0010F5A8C3|nr:hypothetical protein [Chitinivorax sp. B]